MNSSQDVDRHRRLRQTVLWAGRLVLVPGAIVVTLLVALHPFVNIIDAVDGFASDTSRKDSLRARLYLWPTGLAEEQRFIFFGDPKAGKEVDRERSIADRWPGNPVYYANYVRCYMTKLDRDGGRFKFKDANEQKTFLAFWTGGSGWNPRMHFTIL